MSAKQSFYFSHDSNARNDIKIIKLRRELQMEGYGIYWCLIEMLRDEQGNKLPLSAIDDIAFSLNVSKEKVDAVVRRYSLFVIDETDFFSERLLRSMEQYNEKIKRLSQAGKKGMESRFKKEVVL